MAAISEVESVTRRLNDLITTCIDGQKGFAAAAEAVDDQVVKAELSGYSRQRQEFAAELQDLVASLGQSPTESGSVSGAVHRGWLNLRDALSTRDRYAILSECERGEDSAVAEYRKTITAGLPPECDVVVRDQFADVQATHDRVKALRDAYKRA